MKKNQHPSSQIFFGRQAPAGYLEAWQKYLAAPLPSRDKHGIGTILFELGEETFAWPAAAIHTSLKARPIHSLPHQRSPLLLGIVHARGVLLPCMSLAILLGGKETVPAHDLPLLMVGETQAPYLFAVDKLTGFCLFQEQNLLAMPLHDDGHGCYSRGMFDHHGKSVALIDPSLVLSAFERQF